MLTHRLFHLEVDILCRRDLTLHTVGQGVFFCIWLFSCSHSMTLAVRKKGFRLCNDYNLTSNIFGDVNVSA